MDFDPAKETPLVRFTEAAAGAATATAGAVGGGSQPHHQLRQELAVPSSTMNVSAGGRADAALSGAREALAGLPAVASGKKGDPPEEKPASESMWDDGLSTNFDTEEITQARFEEIKARTMFQMVEDVNNGAQKLLFLTNAQADLIASSSNSIEKLITALELPFKPKLLIQLGTDFASPGICATFNPNDNWAREYGVDCPEPSFANHSDIRVALSKIDAFMLDVIIPLACQTNALILCSGIKEQWLAASLTKIIKMQKSKFGTNPPFSVLATTSVINNFYAAPAHLNRHWRVVRRQSRAWCHRDKKIVDMLHAIPKEELWDPDLVDLTPDAPYILVVDTIDVVKDKIGDKQPYSNLVSAISRHLASKVPAIALKTGGSCPTTLESGSLAETCLLRQVDMLNTKVPVVFLDLRERKVCTATDRQSLIEAGMRAFQDSCDALHEAGRCETLDVCMIAYFYEILYGDGNPNTTVSLEAGDGNPVAIHDAIKMHRQRMRVGAGGAGNKYRRMLHKLQPVTNEQIAELCAWMTRLVHTNFWRHNKDREQKEKEGKTYETHYSGEMQCFELCCRVLLSSESFYGAQIDDTKGLSHLLSTLVKLDRLPTENTLEALELLQQAWIEHDIAVHSAAGYKRMARLLYSLYLFIGLVIVTVTTVTGYLLQNPDNAEIAARLQDAVFGLSLFSSFVLTIGAYFNPTKRGRQLRASASTLQSIIWRFRARVGEFLPPPNFPKQPDYNLCAAIASWRRELVAGTDLMSTALEKKYPPHIFTHLQHDGEIKELEDFRKEQMQAHELDLLNSRLLLLQKSQNLRVGSKRNSNGDSHGFFGRGVQVAPAEDDLEGGGKRGEGGAGEVESSFPRNSEIGPEEEKRNIAELEKKIAALSAVAGNFKPRYIDDFQSPVKPMQYVAVRLLNHREFYQVRIPRCYMWMTFWQIVMAVLTVSGAVLAYIKTVSQFVAVSSAVAAAITSWGAYDDLGRRIERYTNAVRSINELVSWWKSLDDVDHANAENITRLIEMGENIINSERQSWLTATSSEDKKNAKEDDKQEEESWAKFA